MGKEGTPAKTGFEKGKKRGVVACWTLNLIPICGSDPGWLELLVRLSHSGSVDCLDVEVHMSRGSRRCTHSGRHWRSIAPSEYSRKFTRRVSINKLSAVFYVRARELYIQAITFDRRMRRRQPKNIR